MSHGYLPLYIKENERNPYTQYLADIQGYGGSPDVYFEFMAGLIIRSQQMMLNTLLGMSLED